MRPPRCNGTPQVMAADRVPVSGGPFDCTRASGAWPPHRNRQGPLPSSPPATNEAESRGLRLRDARHRPQLQHHQPELVRHDARHQAAVVRRPVRRGPQHVRRRAPDAASASVRRPRPIRRPEDHVRVRTVRHRRRRRPDDVPAAACVRRARARSAPARRGARSWTSTCSRTRSSTGDRPAWCSSATCRCAGCRFRATRALTLALERPGASGDAGLLADRIELQNVTRPLSAARLLRRVQIRPADGATFEVAGMLGRIKWDDMLDDQFDLSGERHRLGPQSQLEREVRRQQRRLRLQFVYGEGIQNYMNDSPVDVGIVPTPGNSAAPIKGEAHSDHRHRASSSITTGTATGQPRSATRARTSTTREGQDAERVQDGAVRARQPALHARDRT